MEALLADSVKRLLNNLGFIIIYNLIKNVVEIFSGSKKIGPYKSTLTTEFLNIKQPPTLLNRAQSKRKIDHANSKEIKT